MKRLLVAFIILTLILMAAGAAGANGGVGCVISSGVVWYDGMQDS